MTAESIQKSLPSHVDSLYLAASDLMSLIDQPGMTIETLRACQETLIFRHAGERFTRLMIEGGKTFLLQREQYEKLRAHWEGVSHER